jgi:hypothetical protein
MKIELAIATFIVGCAPATLVILSILQKKVRINVYVIEKSERPVLYVIVTIFWIWFTLFIWGSPWIAKWIGAICE